MNPTEFLLDILSVAIFFAMLVIFVVWRARKITDESEENNSNLN